ncbi:MAG: tRNA pseudouridine(55) synthase TruB [Marinilabiliaceae bacterium]|nr:tRNA pseudouridine(55) synthase TruB [Marinilabiliaceae bacterium]
MVDYSVEAFKEGQILLFNKPYQWTSFDLVNKVRILLRNYCGIKKIKVGHAGTLDPLATGLMIVCTGKATKKIEQLSGLDKEYIATIELGATTPTYDLESQVDNIYPTDHINDELVNLAIQSFIGKIDQVPPIFSALKVNGKKAYELARKGKDVELKSRTIVITKLENISFNMPELTLKVLCSKGTYIRSLAHDFGKRLNSGAHLIALKRTQIGEFNIKDALDLENFERNLQSVETN